MYSIPGAGRETRHQHTAETTLARQLTLMLDLLVAFGNVAAQEPVDTTHLTKEPARRHIRE